MYVSGVQGPSWFGRLQVFSVWHFWQGSQHLLDQVGGESICFENLIYVDAVTLGLEEGSQSQWALSLILLIPR